MPGTSKEQSGDGAELGERPALSLGSPVLPSPSCENLGGMTSLSPSLSDTLVFSAHVHAAQNLPTVRRDVALIVQPERIGKPLSVV